MRNDQQGRGFKEAKLTKVDVYLRFLGTRMSFSGDLWRGWEGEMMQS